MKRLFYIFSFTILGVLLSFLVHGLLEIAALSLILNHFEAYSSSPLWTYWNEIHSTFTILLLIVGVTVGFLSGKHFWRVIYVEYRYGKM